MAQALLDQSPQSPLERAQAAYRGHDFARAEQICDEMLAVAPDDADTLHLLGLLRHQQGREVEALRLVAAALKGGARSPDSLNNYGAVLAALKRQHEALARFEEALALQADHIGALNNRAQTLVALDRHRDALSAYERVLMRDPAHLQALNESGGLHIRLGDPQAALAFFERALAIDPRRPELHINKGKAFRELNRFAEALASFDAAASFDCECVEAHWNAGLMRLRLGDFAAGWRGYEWRWRRPEWIDQLRNFAAPRWLGDAPLDGKTILLHAEQGFGDTLQFVRYAKVLARRGARVVLECQAPLVPLLRNVEGVAEILAQGDALPPFDFHCPLLSLPLAFDTMLQTIPDAVPYVAALAAYAEKWAKRLTGRDVRRVGIVWAGNPSHLNDHNRSIPLQLLAPLFALDGVEFVSLQRPLAAADAALLKQTANVVHLGDDVVDFADTAAIMARLDLVIAVDTAAAHLAGAMGMPVWVLLPYASDWRWLRERTDSPWYPTMRLFRQAAIGDWHKPIAELESALIDALNKPKPAAANATPRSAASWIADGKALVAANKLAEALQCYTAALAADPQNVEAHYQSSLTRLQLGDFAEGWRQYEWRWRKWGGPNNGPNVGAPLWLGEAPLAGKSILLLAEQGLGDTIHFLRYAPLVADRGAKVILGVQAPLKSLAASVPGVAHVLGEGEAAPAFDCYCPLMSLPLAFKTEVATIPNNIPYIVPPQQRLEKWRDRVPNNGRLRVGVCWAGSATNLNDRNRSVPLDRFAALFEVANVDFFSLQKDAGGEAAAILQRHDVDQIARDFADFADTAAAIAMLDLVIAVDTAVAHLAGAMGKAVAVPLPFAPGWRYLLERADMPWYPTMRLYRQSVAGDWSAPLARLCTELAEVARHRATTRG